MSNSIFKILNPSGHEHTLSLSGRDAWALIHLIDAGADGVTPLTNPAPRWSAYIHRLRKIFNINIETVHESHGEPFAGTHARYVLRSNIKVMENAS